jgi:hypothetical protein
VKMGVDKIGIDSNCEKTCDVVTVGSNEGDNVGDDNVGDDIKTSDPVLEIVPVIIDDLVTGDSVENSVSDVRTGLVGVELVSAVVIPGDLVTEELSVVRNSLGRVEPVSVSVMPGDVENGEVNCGLIDWAFDSKPAVDLVPATDVKVAEVNDRLVDNSLDPGIGVVGRELKALSAGDKGLVGARLGDSEVGTPGLDAPSEVLTVDVATGLDVLSKEIVGTKVLVSSVPVIIFVENGVDTISLGPLVITNPGVDETVLISAEDIAGVEVCKTVAEVGKISVELDDSGFGDMVAVETKIVD